MLQSISFAQISPAGINVDLSPIMSSQGISSTVSLLVIMSMITLVPFFLITTTSFLRLIIVLGMLRQAMGTQQSPPSSVLIALSIFMTVFIMTPTINTIIEEGVKPYQAGQISQKEAMTSSIKPFREFMVRLTRENDMALFLEFSKVKYTDNFDEIPLFVIIPSFVLSELRTAFQISFLLFIPFL
ncbi:flagellar biosynthetic protein FliP, partial [Candidatus Marinamargulisbacteria bacterium SCGC AG-343-D04]